MFANGTPTNWILLLCERLLKVNFHTDIAHAHTKDRKEKERESVRDRLGDVVPQDSYMYLENKAETHREKPKIWKHQQCELKYPRAGRRPRITRQISVPWKCARCYSRPHKRLNKRFLQHSGCKTNF